MGLSAGYKYTEISDAKRKQLLEFSKKGSEALSALSLERRKIYNLSPKLCLECKTPMLVSLVDMGGSVFAAVKNRKFCNQSCGAKYNNKANPKRKSQGKTCPRCGGKHERQRGRLCFICKDAPVISVLGSRTKQESRIQEVRRHARQTLFTLKSRRCEICGYSVRVDCCHIKPIKSFSNKSLLSEINEDKNLIALCPNHHVELDLGILKLEERQ